VSCTTTADANGGHQSGGRARSPELLVELSLLRAFPLGLPIVLSPLMALSLPIVTFLQIALSLLKALSLRALPSRAWWRAKRVTS
jgi:hypothetical protein